jgi:murein DD-endopeptidase MepM/ murein hydrolase activator NlpD
MKKTLGERMGGVLRGPRAAFAVAPLFIPLIYATVAPKVPTLESEAAAAAAFMPLVFEPAEIAEPLPPHPICLKIASGDTLETVFTAGGLPLSEATLLAREFAASAVDPRRLRPGDLVRFWFDHTEQITAIELTVTGWGRVVANRTGDGFAVQALEAPVRFERVVVSGEITSSLDEAVRSAGEGHQLVGALADVFQWDVDFFRLRRGDSFNVVVQKRFVGNDHVGYGAIEAAQFVHHGRLLEAFRHEVNGIGGYYGRNGSPMKKQFLRAPLKFTRITSGFTHRRYHPVLNTFRPHYGIDYGAPTGTPVMSTADGVVVHAGFGRAEGNWIRIRHNSRIDTAYLHLSKFAPGLKKGSRVEQGQVIGYVGATGLATGPHLDYRVSDGGKWINPKELRSVTADPLSGAQLTRFRESLAGLIPLLEQKAQLASNQAGTAATAPF